MSFKSWNSYWDFSDSVRNKNRYIFDRESQEFLDSLLETSKDRIRTIEKGGVLWRSQNGHSHKPLYSGEIHISDEPTAFPPNRMKPLAYNASDGRANPKGIPYLYVATTKDTAMAEVRPWLGSIISTAQFKVTRDLRIVEFYTENGNERHFYFDEPTEEKRVNSVWSHVDSAFSEPASVSNVNSDYAPTQIIAEIFKSKGFDGVAYKSSLGDGHNLALFDLESAELINCCAYETKRISFEFKQIENPYIVKQK